MPALRHRSRRRGVRPHRARRSSARTPRSSSSPARTSPRRRCWPRRARCSPTSTPRAIPASATTAATRSSTRPRTSPATRVKALFGAEHANVQPHSGANANMAVYLALLDTRRQGARPAPRPGRPPHPRLAGQRLGRLYDFVAYGVTPSDERIDYDQIRDLARLEHRPKMIVAGTTSYPRRLDPEPFRAIADEVGALLMFDAAHIAGLIAGGVHPDPVPHADVVTFTTHKTLRGPRGGCILCKARSTRAKAIDKAVFPGSRVARSSTSSRPRRWRSARPPPVVQGLRRRDRAQRARRWPRRSTQEGFRLVSGGTDNHLMLVDLRSFDAELTGKDAQIVLDRAGVTLNKNTIPDDPRSPFVTSGLRIGTPAVTTQGMGEPEMAEPSPASSPGARASDDDAELAAVRDEVAALCAQVHALPRARRRRHRGDRSLTVAGLLGVRRPSPRSSRCSLTPSCRWPWSSTPSAWGSYPWPTTGACTRRALADARRRWRCSSGSSSAMAMAVARR